MNEPDTLEERMQPTKPDKFETASIVDMKEANRLGGIYNITLKTSGNGVKHVT